MSCCNMELGMRFDCETCLQSRFGEVFDEEQVYFTRADTLRLSWLKSSSATPEICTSKRMSDHGSGSSCGSQESVRSALSSASSARDLFG
eukprot:764655-Hanusia_phi.AAC.2